MTDLPTLQDNDAEPNKEQDSTSMLEDALEDLSTKSTLDMFRMFFDIKPAVWDQFQGRLRRHLQVNYSWGIIQNDDKKRRECAETFLDEVGPEYWGTPEGREKYLVEERVKNEDSCVYPIHKKPLTEALVRLLEKKVKGRRESIAQNATGSRQDTGPSSDTTTETEAAPSATSISQETPTVTASPVVKPDASPETIKPASRVQDRPLLPPFGNTDRSQASQPAIHGLSTFDHSNFRTRPLSLAYDSEIRSGPSQRVTAAQHQLATFFMIRYTDSDDQPQHVCVPFEIFQNADRFLDRMAEKATEFDPVWGQIRREMPQLDRRQVKSALVYLRWSGVSFVIRRGTDDLQALTDRVGCAWRAKNQGELRTFEFEIEVILKTE